MKINLSNLIRQKTTNFIFSEEVDFSEEDNEEYKFISLVKAEYEVSILSTEVLLRGSFIANLEFICSRCLNGFEKSISGEFEASFYNKNDYDEYNKYDEKEHFFYPEEGSKELIIRDEIDAGKVLRENVILSIPYANICSQNCKGLEIGNVFE